MMLSCSTKMILSSRVATNRTRWHYLPLITSLLSRLIHSGLAQMKWKCCLPSSKIIAYSVYMHPPLSQCWYAVSTLQRILLWSSFHTSVPDPFDG
ncbi:hypothetical protein EV421DRAFT_568049 [Armillaria borealis]|uniref:Uncharacterized protein n=1 Tax=Armillaria borealis TaxID=47425 RepID=A0AA39JGX7_9AGAR|nr:hypothetical protein EV421DRAFT_568049 [Armillaria borealis]